MVTGENNIDRLIFYCARYFAPPTLLYKYVLIYLLFYDVCCLVAVGFLCHCCRLIFALNRILTRKQETDTKTYFDKYGNCRCRQFEIHFEATLKDDR